MKSGYKQTDIGVLPDNWEVESFEDAFDFLSSAAYSRAQLSELADTAYVHYGDIHTKYEHFIDFDKAILPMISEEQSRKYHLLKDGDLIIVDASEDYSGVGKTVEIKNLGSRKAISGLHTFLLRGKKGNIANGFKGYIRLNPLVKSQFERLATGLKVYGVSRTNLKKIQFPLPPPAEQQAIAAALSEADALLAALDEKIAKKRDIKQAAMQQLLSGKKRLSGFGGIKPKWKKTEIGEVPADWDVKRLDQVADIDSENLSASTDSKYEFKYISLENVNYGTLEGFSEISFSVAPSRARRIVRKDDVIVSTVRPNLKSHYFFREDVKNMVCSTGFSVLRKRDNLIEPAYLYFHFFADLINKQIDAVIAGSNYPAINGSDIALFTIPLPPPLEQQAIAAILIDMDAEIATLEKLRAKRAAIKQGMMQELLTGRTRLISDLDNTRRQSHEHDHPRPTGKCNARARHPFSVRHARLPLPRQLAEPPGQCEH